MVNIQIPYGHYLAGQDFVLVFINFRVLCKFLIFNSIYCINVVYEITIFGVKARKFGVVFSEITLAIAFKLRELFLNGQVAFQYVDPVEEEPTMDSPYNPNGSYYAIEGIISKDGHILGKMGHTERYEKNVFKNIDEELEQPLFENAVRYFRGK